MPSNQAPRPLTRPKGRSSGATAFVAASTSVIRAGKALTVFCTTFLFLSFLFALRSPGQVASAGRQLEGYVAGSLRHGSSAAGSQGNGCHAIQLPGWISVNLANPQALPIWETFDNSCSYSHIVSSLVDATSPLQEANAPRGNLDFLSNRTVLLITDLEPTQARLKTLCTTLKAEYARVDVAHPWGAALQKRPSADGQDMGSYCYLAEKDLLIHHFPHSGLLAPSQSVESRILSLVPQLTSAWITSNSPALPSLPLRRARRAPDLTVWSSVTSDLAFWQQGGGSKTPGAGAGATSTSASVPRNLVDGWRRRNLVALEAIKSAVGSGSSGGRTMWLSPGYGDLSTLPDPSSSNGLSTTAQLYSAQLATILAGDKGTTDRFLSSLPYSLRLPSATGARSRSCFAGEVPWRHISDGLESLIGPSASVGVAARGAELEAALWGETILASLGLVV
ncbi:unnamed protein product [Parajaminaea phylloscopi]